MLVARRIMHLGTLRRGALPVVAGMAVAPVALVWDSSPAAPAGPVPSIAISPPANPTLTSRGVMLRGDMAPGVAPAGGATPTGTVSWSVTSATGQAVPCASGVTQLTRAGKTSCRIAPHELSAADGPYTATLSYPGDPNFGASTQTFTLPVSKDNSRTRLHVTGHPGSGSPASFRAKVTGVPSSAGTPTGTVTFAVSGSSDPLQCDGGTNALTLSSGVATCTVTSAPAGPRSSYTALVTYSGDGNFKPSDNGSTSASTAVSKGVPQDVSALPSGTLTPPTSPPVTWCENWWGSRSGASGLWTPSERRGHRA